MPRYDVQFTFYIDGEVRIEILHLWEEDSEEHAGSILLQYIMNLPWHIGYTINLVETEKEN